MLFKSFALKRTTNETANNGWVWLIIAFPLARVDLYYRSVRNNIIYCLFNLRNCDNDPITFYNMYMAIYQICPSLHFPLIVKLIVNYPLFFCKTLRGWLFLEMLMHSNSNSNKYRFWVIDLTTISFYNFGVLRKCFFNSKITVKLFLYY